MQQKLSEWCSTYSIITAERIFENFAIKLSQIEVIRILQNPNSFYYQLLRIPLKNVFNGIILQQVQDYQGYAQKLFVDYLLSGETAKETEQGELTRENLENSRQTLINMNNIFYAQELEHEKLINNSQKLLIKYNEIWTEAIKSSVNELLGYFKNFERNQGRKIIMQVLNNLLSKQEFTSAGEVLPIAPSYWPSVELNLGQPISENMKELFSNQIISLKNIVDDAKARCRNFIVQSDAINEQLVLLRRDFYNLIVSIFDLMKMLPEYQMDPLKDKLNREVLYFDTTISNI